MLEAARERSLPVVVHIRDAFEEAFEIMAQIPLRAGGVLHCFTGGPAEAERALSLGYHLSFSGVLTFKKAEALREALLLVPDDRLLVETDAPFLAPTPRRGRRNEPAYVVHTARKMAELKGLSYEALARLTCENTRRLFQLRAL